MDTSVHMLPSYSAKKLISTPIIVEADIEGFFVNRVYIDGGATREIKYERCFLQLSEDIKSCLQALDTPLVGFSGVYKEFTFSVSWGKSL